MILVTKAIYHSALIRTTIGGGGGQNHANSKENIKTFGMASDTTSLPMPWCQYDKYQRKTWQL